MLTCPHCKQRAMSYWRKVNMVRPMPCQSCGRSVTVSRVWLVPWVLGILAVWGYQPPSPWKYPYIVGVFVAVFLIHMFAVPLSKHEP